MEFLRDEGIRFGEGGITHTTARHRRTYYMTESRRCMRLLNEYRHNDTIQILSISTIKIIKMKKEVLHGQEQAKFYKEYS